jgi:hypothetical protein
VFCCEGGVKGSRERGASLVRQLAALPAWGPLAGSCTGRPGGGGGGAEAGFAGSDGSVSERA